MGQAARLGDSGSHKGKITSASPDVFINGKAVARKGDIYGCPIHGPNPLMNGLSPDILANDKFVAVQGMTTAMCGALIIEGSPDVFDN